MKRSLLYIIPLLLFAITIVGCTKYFNPEPKFEDYKQEEEKTVKRKVMLIAIDEIVGKEVKKKVTANISQMMKTGKYSFDALTDNNTTDPSSWATMVTGYNSDAHNIKDDSYLPQPNSSNPHEIGRASCRESV